MPTSITNRSLVITILATILILCLSSSSSIPTVSGSPLSIESQYSSILGPNIDKLPTQDEAIQLFQLWKKEHGRVYNDLEEMAKRFNIFVSNLKYITESNAKRESSHGSFYGLTNFADLSKKEFKRLYLNNVDMPIDNIIDMPTNNITEIYDDNINADSIDWRSKGAVTPVKNQNPCGCCYAFTAAGAVEGINKIKTGKLISLSAQEIVDCDSGSQGCTGGWVHTAFNWILDNGGLASDADYPFTAKKGSCKASKTPKRATIDDFHSVKPSQSESAMLSATARQPISVYYWATDDFQHFKSREIYNGPNCKADDYSKINHAMLIVGYGSENGKDYWIVKNSWSTKWGDNGYIRIKRNTGKRYGVCAINTQAYYPVKYGKAELPYNSI